MEQTVRTEPELTAAFKAAMRRFAATVTIITVGDRSVRHGMTATAVTSLSAEPPSLLVCVNQAASLHERLQNTSSFCVNILHRDQIKHSRAFSGGLRGEERFQIGDWALSENGAPFLVDAQANLFCRRAAAIPYRTHTIFIGEVVMVQTRAEVAPLLYQNCDYAVGGAIV